MISRVLSSVAPIVLNGNDTHHPMDEWSMMGGLWWIWIIVAIAVVLVVVLLVVLVIGGDQNTGGGSNPGKSARELLDERYARGEITEEEYEKKKKEMKK